MRELISLLWQWAVLKYELWQEKRELTSMREQAEKNSRLAQKTVAEITAHRAKIAQYLAENPDGGSREYFLTLDAQMVRMSKRLTELAKAETQAALQLKAVEAAL